MSSKNNKKMSNLEFYLSKERKMRELAETMTEEHMRGMYIDIADDYKEIVALCKSTDEKERRLLSVLGEFRNSLNEHLA